jgi:hypothetical protein
VRASVAAALSEVTTKQGMPPFVTTGPPWPRLNSSPPATNGGAEGLQRAFVVRRTLAKSARGEGSPVSAPLPGPGKLGVDAVDQPRVRAHQVLCSSRAMTASPPKDDPYMGPKDTDPGYDARHPSTADCQSALVRLSLAARRRRPQST